MGLLILQWRIQGRGSGGPAPPFFLAQTEAQRAISNFFGDGGGGGGGGGRPRRSFGTKRRPKGKKQIFLETAPPPPPPYLWVCMTGLPHYLKVWIRHCFVHFFAFVEGQRHETAATLNTRKRFNFFFLNLDTVF